MKKSAHANHIIRFAVQATGKLGLFLFLLIFCFHTFASGAPTGYGDKPIPALEPYLSGESSSDSEEPSSSNETSQNTTPTEVSSSSQRSVNSFFSTQAGRVILYLIPLLLGFGLGFILRKKTEIPPEEPSEEETLIQAQEYWSYKEQENERNFIFHALCQIRLLLNHNAKEFEQILSLGKEPTATQSSILRHKLTSYLKDDQKEIYKAVNRLCALTQGIIVKPIKIDVVQMMEKSLQAFQDTSLSYGITIQTKFPSEPVILYADYSLLKEVFLILMENAGKYAQTPNATLSILIKETKDRQCFIQFHDDGKGMSDESAEHLLEYEYFRGINHPQRGIGLGLFYASEILFAQEGSIWFKSKPDKGFSANILLPLPKE